MKNAFSIVMFALVVLSFSSCSKNPIQKEIDEINKSLPVEIARGVTNTKVEYDKSKDAITYYLDIDAFLYEMVEDSECKGIVKQVMTDELCKNAHFKTLDVKKYIYNCRNIESGENFTISVDKDDLEVPSDNPIIVLGDESIQAGIDEIQSELPMDFGNGIEWIAIRYNPLIGRVIYIYNISEDMYDTIHPGSSGYQIYVDDIIKECRNNDYMKNLNVKSHSWKYITDSGKNFTITKTWDEIFG